MFLLLCCPTAVKVFQSCPTLWHPKDYTGHGILQARILEWVVFPTSKGSFQTRDKTQVPHHCRQILYQLSHQGSPRILEWVAYSFSRGSSSQTRDWTQGSCIAGRFFTRWATEKPHSRLATKSWVPICQHRLSPLGPLWLTLTYPSGHHCPLLCYLCAPLHLTHCDPTDCSPPGPSVRGILQARILEWVVMPSSRGSSWPRDRTCISCVSGMAGGSLSSQLLGKPFQKLMWPKTKQNKKANVM